MNNNYYPNRTYNRMDYNEFFNSLGLNNMNDSYMTNDNMNQKIENSFTDSYEGYIRGNMNKDEYIGYKNYKPVNLNPSNEKEELLYNLSQKHFGMHEANLNLDVNPNGTMMMNNYRKYRDEYNKLYNEYQSKYGPLNINDSTLNSIPFGWVETNFPWGGEM